MSDLAAQALQLARDARDAFDVLVSASAETRSAVIADLAKRMTDATPRILEANAKDLAAATELAPAMRERLRLDEKRVAKMAQAVAEIAEQPDPVGKVDEAHTRPDGLHVERRRVPIGVVLFCYESRPNVTSDAAALCLRSGNAVILRGGKEAFHTNAAVAEIIAETLAAHDLPPACAALVPSVDRNLLTALLKQDRYVDLVIPRGGEGLIRAVVKEATMPVLKHFTGNCHIYIDAAAPSQQEVIDVIVNAKTGYAGGGVCNAVEHVLIHRDQAAMVPALCDALIAKGVEVRGDEIVQSCCNHVVPATPDDWDAEYLSLILGLKVVNSFDAAVGHINRHGSRHTDAILTTDTKAADAFIKRVDSASVMVNASTRFADGGEYGLGAEIGISTDKLHARGPMGAADMTTYKWVVTGNGHTR